MAERYKRALSGVIAATVLAVSMATMVPTAAASVTPSDIGTQNVNCSSTYSGKTGYATCTNNTTRTLAFRARIVCGLAPDGTGNWVTLRPGERGTSKGTCPSWSSGIGGVNWQIR